MGKCLLLRRSIGWSDLPPELRVKVMEKYVDLCGICTAARIRQVSKAWAADFRDIPANLNYRENNYLPMVEKLLPRTSSLQYSISNPQSPLYQRTLVSFSELSKLQLEKSEHHCAHIVPKVDLGCIPRSIHHLELSGVTLSPDSSMVLLCTELKQLHCKNAFVDTEIHKQLPHLTKLEVSLTLSFPLYNSRSSGNAYSSPRRGADLQKSCRMVNIRLYNVPKSKLKQGMNKIVFLIPR